MWVNRQLFDMIVKDNGRQQAGLVNAAAANAAIATSLIELRAQKAKDDLSLDWLRHRVNALEKQNAILMHKATGLAMPVPEIVPTRPGTITPPLEFDTMPSFEDCGPVEAARLGISHDEAGQLVYTK